MVQPVSAAEKIHRLGVLTRAAGENGLNMLTLFEDTRRTAVFSPCRKYRYRLDIVWDESFPAVNYLMANPSKADEIANDPTFERCERRARAGGFGSLIVTNLFALVSTDPGQLKFDHDPVGPDNDLHIVEAAQTAKIVVCAWGSVGCVGDRPKYVLAMLQKTGVILHALRLGEKAPWHPLYVSYDQKPIIWKV